MRTFEGIPGEHIDDFCRRLVAEREAVGADTVGDFNGIGLVARDGVTADDLARHYAEESQRRHDALLARHRAGGK